tara:strand:+ start:466 stop:1143 length:678 start_codon:yes stop_codon:yes gene_type:complete
MATNSYFNNYGNFNEQQLIDDLVIESIKIYGVDIIYLSRSLQSVDSIMNEDDISIFNETFEFEVYLKNVDGFEGQGDFLSKFGLQIQDEVTFTVAYRTFERFVTREKTTKTRPLEGDIIYFPLTEKMYRLNFVEHESVFYQAGTLQVYDMRCELIEYSGERLQTGRANIDNYFNNIDTSNTSSLESLSTLDVLADNLDFENAGDAIIDFSEIDPFSETLDITDLT